MPTPTPARTLAAPSHTSFTALFGGLAIAAGILFSGQAALAQSSKPASKPTPAKSPARTLTKSPAKPAATETATQVPQLRPDAPYTIPSLGLTFLLPEDSLVDLNGLAGGSTRVTIRPQGDMQPWVIQVHNSISRDTGLTLQTALDNIIAQRKQGRTGIDQKGNAFPLTRDFDRIDNLELAGMKAQRVYLNVPTDPSAPTTGYTVFQTGPGQFVIFQLDCVTADFPAIRTLYESLVASAAFRDPSEVSADRSGALAAGESFLSHLTDADFEAVLDAQPTYFRVYTPAPSGAPGDASEIAYQRIQARKGQAGELDPRKPKDRWTQADREFGYLVRIEARSLSMGGVIDTVSVFFLSRDRKNELWSITMEVRKDKGREQWVETGIRRAERLTVKTVKAGAEPVSVDYALPSAYISRVEAFLLPRLVARVGVAASLGFYGYESSLGKLTLRRETFDKEDGGRWALKSQSSENSPVVSSTLDSAGKLVKRLLAEGQIMEPIDQPRLKKLWSDKKLPLD